MVKCSMAHIIWAILYWLNTMYPNIFFLFEVKFVLMKFSEPTIYLTCVIHICDDEVDQCLPNCSSARRRRSYLAEKSTGTLKVGPISIAKP